ncbi:MAG: imelysin family protein [Pseudohongiellaceae bacterium]
MQTLPSLGSSVLGAAKALPMIMLFLFACSEEEIVQPDIEVSSITSPSSFKVLNPALNTSAMEIALDYVEQIGVDFSLAEADIARLQSAVDTLINLPTQDNLDLAKQVWLSAHGSYELTALHRYFASQVFNEQQGLELMQLQYQINHWPIVPGYIDYVDGYIDSGIVNDINVRLDSIALREQHGVFDVSEVTLGFHVIEFLLWGNNTYSNARPVDDYLAIEQLNQDLAQSGYTLDQLGNNRRRQLLTLVTSSLLEDFRSLHSLWLTQLPETRLFIEDIAGPEVIIILADSMAAMLTEELLLRSMYPMLNGNFVESVQSPFSLSTQIAVSTQLSGLERLLLERQTENGTTLDLIFSAISNEFSEFFYQNFDASKSCLVLLYRNLDSATTTPLNQGQIEIVECINLLTNMVSHIERLKFELSN